VVVEGDIVFVGDAMVLGLHMANNRVLPGVMIHATHFGASELSTMTLPAFSEAGGVEIGGVAGFALEEPVAEVLAVGVCSEGLKTREGLLANATEKPPKEMLLHFVLDNLRPCATERASGGLTTSAAGGGVSMCTVGRMGGCGHVYEITERMIR
jgi:hypothetical protein